ncbi:MAG: hypothetical protein ACRYGC_01270, partial [Janthinobacterium lividum]
MREARGRRIAVLCARAPAGLAHGPGGSKARHGKAWRGQDRPMEDDDTPPTGEEAGTPSLLPYDSWMEDAM